MSKLFEELKRRKVVRVAGVYAVVAWLLIQVTNNIVPALQLPAWATTLIVVLLLIGFPIALVLAWAYEVTPDGIRADNTDQSTTHAPAPQQQKLIYAMFVLLLIAVSFQIADRFLTDSNSSNQNLDAAAIRSNLLLPETRLDIVTPATEFAADFALSPDGRQLVFVASDDSGVAQLWLRSLETTTAQPLAGTEEARWPFWSPDGRSIGFLTQNALKRLDVGGGAPRTLASLNNPSGGTWGADNTLLFIRGNGGPVMRVSATGGEVTAVTTIESEHTGHRNPYFLPDGRRFLFTALGSPETAGLYLGHLDGSASTKLTAGGSGAFHPDGWLLWNQTSTLTAQRLDLTQAVLTGEPIVLADGVEGRASVSTTGLIAYRTGSESERQLTWFERSGTELGTMGEPYVMRGPRLSPDGRRVAVDRLMQGNWDIWLLDVARSTRFTFDAAEDLFPLWSPDGSRIVFRASQTGSGDIYQRSSNGTGEETLLVGSDQLETTNSWSADGRFLLYHTSPLADRDLWALPMTGDSVPFVVLQTPFEERWGAFSPDGRWIAYQSNESGRYEIYVRAFVAPDASVANARNAGGQWQVSTAGGIYPVWSANGQEVYYVDPAGNMVAAPLIATGEAVEVGAPAVLFPTRIYGGGAEFSQGRQYDVAADGRFLINTVVREGRNDPITLIQNWSPEAVQ